MKLNLAISTLILLGFLMPKLSMAETTIAKTISVKGNCLKKIHPDRGSIVLAATSLKPTSKEALSEASKMYEELKSEIKNLKLKDLELESTAYQIYEEKSWNASKEVSRGFKARLGLEVSTSEIGRLGEIIPIAGKLKITEIGNLNQIISPKLMLEEKESCLDQAMQNARQKADRIASSAKVKIKSVAQVSESESNEYYPQTMAFGMASAKVMDATERAPEVESKTQQITSSLNVIFAIE